MVTLTRLNHYGKLFFEWIYWHMLLTGKPIPVPANMSMMGKHTDRIDVPVPEASSADAQPAEAAFSE